MPSLSKLKPVIRVHLLPANWGEGDYEALHTSIVAAATQVMDEHEIETEDDLIVLFPPDLMKKGLGTEIVVEIDLPPYP